MADYYKRHVFFCTNQKAEGKKCCQQADAKEMCRYFKKRLVELEQHGKGKIRVSQSTCLGRCGHGPCIVIYPEQTWYSYESTEDLDTIIEKDLLNNEKVNALEIPSKTP